MLVRIVKMTFKKENIASFEQLFDKNKLKIRGFEGCSFLELYRDNTNPEIFFTYSYWKDEKHLHDYRNSELFKSVWDKTRPLFSKRSEAWSVDKILSIT